MRLRSLAGPCPSYARCMGTLRTVMFPPVHITARTVTLLLAETFTIARGSQ